MTTFGTGLAIGQRRDSTTWWRPPRPARQSSCQNLPRTVRCLWRRSAQSMRREGEMVLTARRIIVLVIAIATMFAGGPAASAAEANPTTKGGFITDPVIPNGVTPRYDITALPKTKPAVLHVEIGGAKSPYRIKHPGYGQTVKVDVYRALELTVGTPEASKGRCGWYCKIKVLAYRPGKEPVLIYSGRWKP